MITRIGFNLFIFISILLLPWYSYALFIVAGFFLYDNYYEGIAWGIVLDMTYGSVSDPVYWYTVSSVGLFLLVKGTKPYIKFYD